MVVRKSPISKNLSSVNYILQLGVLDSIIVYNYYFDTLYSEYHWIILLADGAFLFVYSPSTLTGHAKILHCQWTIKTICIWNMREHGFEAFSNMQDSC